MKLTIPWIICSVAVFLLPGTAWTQSGEVRQVSAAGADPSDMYLHAWNLLSAAEKSAKKRDYMTAVKQMRECELILAAISKDRPDWKSNMISFRRQKNTELLEKWIQLAKEQVTNTPPSPLSPEKSIHPIPSPARDPLPKLPANKLPSYESMQAKAGRSVSGGSESPYLPPAVLPEQGESSYDRLNRELMRSQMENKALIKALRQTRRDLEDALTRKVHAESGESVYKSQLKELREAIEKERATGNELLVNLTRRLNEAEAKLKTAEQERKNVQLELDQLKQRLEETETQLAEVSQERDSLQLERDSLKKERDHLAAILELNSPEKTKNLLDRNLTLVSQLKNAQNKIQQLENEKINNEDQKAVNLQELERTREESAKIKLSLAALMDENVGYRRRITELNNQLTNSEAELKKIEQLPKADPLVIEENRLLRSTVSKHLQLLANQIKSRDLMMDAYKRLKLKDSAMVESIQLLGDSSLYKLTPEEQKLAEAISSVNIPTPEGDQEAQSKLAAAEKSAREEKEKTIRKQLESEALGKAALVSFEKGRFAAAEQLYRTLLDEQPELFPARVNMATILLKRNLVEEAIAHLTKAIQINPESSPVNFLLGIAHYRVGNDNKAVSCFLEAVRIQPDNIQAYVYLGNISSSAGQTDKAVEYYDKALAIKSSLPDVIFNKASTLAKAGKLKEARKFYDLSIREGSLPDPEMEQLLTSPDKPDVQAEKEQTVKSDSKQAEIPLANSPIVTEKHSASVTSPPVPKAPESAIKPHSVKQEPVKKTDARKDSETKKESSPSKIIESTPTNTAPREKTPRNRRFRIG